MERPPKRRRTGTPPRLEDDEEIENEDSDDQIHPEVRDRLAARHRFKLNLERIFEKYSRDFTGVGDEIDLLTGKVVVDNGHLSRMQEEDDVGDDTEDQDGYSDIEPQLDADEVKRYGQTNNLSPNSEDEPLESLHIGSTFDQSLHTPTHLKQRTFQRSRDPAWQIPEILQVDARNSEDEDEDHARRNNPILVFPRPSRPSRRPNKSPGGSLWKYVRKSKRRRPNALGQGPAKDSHINQNEGEEILHNEEDLVKSINLFRRNPLMGMKDALHTADSLDDSTDEVPEEDDEYHSRSETEPMTAVNDLSREDGMSDGSSASRISELLKPRKFSKSTMKKYKQTWDALKQSSARIERQDIPLEDMWRAFPSIGEPAIIQHGHDTKESIGIDLNSALNPSEDVWKTHNETEKTSPILAPYSETANQSDATKAQPEAKHNASASIREGGIIDKQLKNAAGVLPKSSRKANRLLRDDGRSRASSSTVDLMRLGSETFIQHTDYTPVSLRSPPQNDHSIDKDLETCSTYSESRMADKSNTDEQTLHEKQEISKQTLMLQSLPKDASDNGQQGIGSIAFSIPNTTQDESSPLRMRSSAIVVSEDAELCVAPGRTEPLNELSILKTKRDGIDNLVDCSRESSPLSSLSGSTPSAADAMTKPVSEIESAVPKSPPRITTTTAKHIEPSDLGVLGNEADNEPNNIEIPELNYTEDTKALALDTPLGCWKPAEQQVEPLVCKTEGLRNESCDIVVTVDQPSIQGQRYEGSLVSGSASEDHRAPREESIIEPTVDFVNMDDAFQMMNQSFEESQTLIQASVDRQLLGRQSKARPAEAKVKRPSINRPFIPVRPMTNDGNVVSGKHSPQRTTGSSTPSQSVINTSAANTDRRTNTSNHGLASTAPDKEQITPRYLSRPAQRRLKVQQQDEQGIQMGSKQRQILDESNRELDTDDKLSRETRSATPIDTYCYILADPWPTEGLPGDRIPEAVTVRKQAAFPEEPQNQSQILLKPNNQPLSVKKLAGRPSISSIRKPRTIDGKENATIQKIVPEQSTKFVVNKTETASAIQTHATAGSKAFKSASQEVRKRASWHENEPSDCVSLPELSIVPKESKTNVKIAFPQSPGRLPADGSAEPSRRRSPILKESDILNQYGRGRPLTKANLRSQDEIPSTSQDTILSFLNSQATVNLPRPSPLINASRTHQEPHRRSASSVKICGTDGYQCGRRYCFNCTSRAATQEEVEF